MLEYRVLWLDVCEFPVQDWLNPTDETNSVSAAPLPPTTCVARTQFASGFIHSTKTIKNDASDGLHGEKKD